MEVEIVNMKKLFPEKKERKKGFVDFLDKKGFYVVLILCIAIVGVTAVILSTNNITSSGIEPYAKIIPEATDQDSTESIDVDDSVVEEETDISQTSQSAVVIPSTTSGSVESIDKAVASASAESGDTAADVKKDDTKKEEPKKEDNTKKSSNTRKVTSSEKFITPVFGEISLEYAQDKLLYSKTLEEWRTHSGVDLAADRGTHVKAVADGVVSEIKNDPRFGITIIIDHKNGLKTIYANLASDEMVTANQKIKQGDVIGAVGNTAAFESLEKPHLHFEVLKGNKPVDPTTYLPKTLAAK